MEMKKFVSACLLCLCTGGSTFAGSMFDENGQYSGNWKPMTNIQTQSSSRYKSSDYSSSAWYAENRNRQKAAQKASYSAQSYTEANTVPYRYNTLNYTRIRKVKGGHGDYNAKCSDIGDASFCR